MPAQVDGEAKARAFIDGRAQALAFLDGVEVFRAPGITVPEIQAVGFAPPFARAGVVAAQTLRITVEPKTAGTTITLHRGDGSNVPATTPGEFSVTPVPVADEEFRVTVVNQASETITRRKIFRGGVTDPVWTGPTARRVREAPGTGSVAEVWELTASLACHPKPTLELRGDSYYRRVFPHTDFGSHLSGSAGVYAFSLRVSFTRQAGHAWRQALTLRATNPLTSQHADAVFTIDIPGA